MRFSLILFAVALGCASPAVRPQPRSTLPESPAPVARPTYPPRFERRSDEQIAAREREFRERNPEPWTEVRIDEFTGLLAWANIVQPEPTAMPATPTYDDDEMRARWGAFLERNADVLGLRAPNMAPRTGAPREIGFLQTWGRWPIGFATVNWYDVGYESPSGRWRPARIDVSGHGWLEPLPEVQELSDDEIAARWVGARGTLHRTYIAVPHPCDPTGRFNNCPRSSVVAPPPTQEPYALTRGDVIVQRFLRRCHPSDGVLELRIVAEIDHRITAGCPGREEIACNAGVVLDEPAPPRRIDAVTGEDLSALACER